MQQDIQTPEQLTQFLTSINQTHLLEGLDKHSPEDIKEFITQINTLNANYPGGLIEYGNRARKLLLDSKDEVNPFADYTPHVPQGETIDFKTESFLELEKVGLQEIKSTCFVLVAGGLGERLGYDGIKVALPIELVTRRTFLEYYCQYILALQNKHANGELPFAIMTSDDTHTLTLKLLQDNSYFGLNKSQVHLIKQEKVPAMMDNEARFTRIPGKLLLETKPHGHGDIHTLLFMSGLAQKWNDEGRKWLFIIQDTNPLAFRALPSVLGVSKQRGFELNTITVPRKPGEAVGGICQLTKSDGSSITINVEYNQLDPLMKTVGGEPVDVNGYSKYPGNTNCLLFSLPEYSVVLAQSKGLIAEFINPKYADASKTKFKSSSRLECMMQDYPKLLSSASKVGFSQIDRRYCFSACKNDLGTATLKSKSNLPTECAGSCEGDFYWLNAELLKLAGAQIEETKSVVNLNGLELNFGPKVVLHPSFGVSLSELKQRIQKNVKISGKSTVVLSGECQLNNVQVNGVLKLHGNGKFDGVVVDDGRYNEIIALDDDAQPGYLKIRGYRLI